MSDIINRALQIVNEDIVPSPSPQPVVPKQFARGGYADGGDPTDPVASALDVAQSMPDQPLPDLKPAPRKTSTKSAEGRIAAPPPIGHNMPPSSIPQGKGVSYRTPDDIAAPIIEDNKSAGLQFPEDESFARLHKKLRREDKAASGKETAGDPLNDRMIIKAPKNSGLPDFATGKINYDDWIKRHENILGDDEIHHAADWYNRIADEFKQYYPDDKEAKRNMRAWLVAQQNVSPAGAMQNVLLQKEQMARGVPKDLWRAGGMPNPTEAARAVLQDQPIGGGVGQKIADFVDAAEGKKVRSWMANHPDGGDPFVVDVHTARDTGMVDQELLNHLDRLGYDKKDLAKAKIDLTGTPTEAAYENRAAWGRGLTDHLNKIGWKGRNDWTPAEVQAVGWMGMTKLTRNAEEDVQSGLAKNLRRLSFEIDPGEGSPWQDKYGKHFSSLTPDEKADITSKIADSAMQHASKLAGIDVHSLVHGTGAREQHQNPAAVGQTLATHEGADIAANALGYLLNQTEVWHNRMKGMTTNPKGFGIDFIQKDGTELADKEYLKDFWQKVMDHDDTGLFKGFQPITLPSGEVGIRALIDKGGAKTREKIEKALQPGSPISKLLESFPHEIHAEGNEAEITKARNDWTENKDGKIYLERLEHLIGPDKAASLPSLRQQLESELEGHFEKTRQRKAGATQDASEKVEKSLGGSIGAPPFIEDTEDMARRLILWSSAVAPLTVRQGRKDGGSVKEYPLKASKKLQRALSKGEETGHVAMMSPETYLEHAKRLPDTKEDNLLIDAFKSRMKKGKKFKALKLLANNRADGRHRATAAEELGIKEIPVIDYRKSGLKNMKGVHSVDQKGSKVGKIKDELRKERASGGSVIKTGLAVLSKLRGK